MKRESARRFLGQILLFLPIFFLFVAMGWAEPSESPPDGKVWVQEKGEWILVEAPPGDGPYVWSNEAWVASTVSPSEGMEWVPGRWTPKGWMPGHWVSVERPGSDVVWVVGYWSRGWWVRGYWRPMPSPMRWRWGPRPYPRPWWRRSWRWR